MEYIIDELFSFLVGAFHASELLCPVVKLGRKIILDAFGAEFGHVHSDKIQHHESSRGRWGLF